MILHANRTTEKPEYSLSKRLFQEVSKITKKHTYLAKAGKLYIGMYNRKEEKKYFISNNDINLPPQKIENGDTDKYVKVTSQGKLDDNDLEGLISNCALEKKLRFERHCL